MRSLRPGPHPQLDRLPRRVHQTPPPQQIRSRSASLGRVALLRSPGDSRTAQDGRLISHDALISTVIRLKNGRAALIALPWSHIVRVLLVEDHKPLSRSLKRGLEEEGLAV